MKNRVQSIVHTMLSVHVRAAALALLPLLIWGTYHAVSVERAALLEPPVEIGVEHDGSGGIAIAHGMGGNAHMTDIANESAAVMYVSLPADWQRDEIRGAPLASLTVEAPIFGFRRWSIPPGATVSYRTPADWRALTVHNPAGTLLRVKVTTVYLDRNEADTDVYLLNDKRLDLSF